MVGNREAEVLSVGDCLELLDTTPVGRLVLTERALPAFHPVDYVRHGRSLIVRTGPGSELDAARRRDVVAFEADHVDPDAHTGWSVMVVGRAGVVDDIERLVAVIDHRYRPWVRGRGLHVIRIDAERVTGRRLVLDPWQDAGDGLGTRTLDHAGRAAPGR
jgi:nitroimidazol reductase NimA-like FMN-containing flavoprotein (pyridoxamine 5'-phosphate oxidase superfamily)